jgi:hypothetical protein
MMTVFTRLALSLMLLWLAGCSERPDVGGRDDGSV